MRNVIVPLAALLAFVLGAGPAAAACQEDSWVAGSVDLCDGELVYRDYVLDDFGAQSEMTPPPPFDYSNLPQGDAYGLLPPSGGEGYAAGQENTADLVELRLGIGGGQVSVSFELGTLYTDSDTVVAVAIDTDADPGTGSCSWPGLSVQPDGAELCESSDSTASVVTLDAAANTIAWSLSQPGGSQWRIQAVTARGDGTVMNAAFRGYGETGFWFDNVQAANLADADLSSFSHTVAVADLAPGNTQLAAPPKGQVLQRVYTSLHTVPPAHEGLDHDGVPGAGFTTANGGSFYSQAYNFLGKYQPYGFYQPDQAGPHGVQLLLHGLGENHSARLFFPGTPNGPGGGGINQDYGEARNRILLAPLGRGWRGWWSEYAERDALDALADVEQNYPTDSERVHVSGYSMGGYGTYRLGGLNVDRFASFTAWVAAAGDYLAGTPFGPFSSTGNEGNAFEFLPNFRHLPGSMLYAGQDELVPVPTALEARQIFADLEYEHIHYLHQGAEHLTFVALDDWTKESAYSAGSQRVVDPARVTFRTLPSTWHPALGLVHDSAYWASGITPADPAEFAEIDLHSFGCGLDDIATSAPFPGAGVGPGSLVWDSQQITATSGGPVAVSNCLQGDLANVTDVTLDVAGTCLSPDPVSYSLTTDGPATVHLSDGRDLVLPSAGLNEGGPPVGQVAPSAALLRLGHSKRFQVACAGGPVLWSVQEGPAGGTIDVTGLYTAPDTITPDGLAHVEARDGGAALIGVATVHLRQAAGRR